MALHPVAIPAERVAAMVDRCPLCEQDLPRDLRVDDLEAKLRERERSATATAEKRLRVQFDEEMATRIEATKRELTAQAAEKEKAARTEAKALAEASLRQEVTNATQARAQAIREKEDALEANKRLKEEQQMHISRAVQTALQEQREILDRQKIAEFQKTQAQEFEKHQKLQEQVQALQRQLEQKRSGDLGEGAEIDLYEALRENFEDDRITRIKKGEPGADIRHEVVYNGAICGSILYDSKNHGAWRGSFVDKLRSDQLADKADHAVLASNTFPSGSKQLVVLDGVVVCSPARVVEVVRIFREHIIQTYRLRLSAEKRGQKTAALYEFISSERCAQLLQRYESTMDDMLELDVKENAIHQSTWKRRGQLIRDAQKVHGTFRAEVDAILGCGETG